MRQGEVRIGLAQMRAISLPARLRLLRLLAGRPRTVSELARRASIPKSSTHRHLSVLEREGFVERRVESALWVYYRLTPLGREVASQDPMRLVVTLGIAVVALVAAAAAPLWWSRSRLAPPEDPPWVIDPIEPAAASAAVVAVAAAGLGLGLLLAAWWWTRRRRRSASARS